VLEDKEISVSLDGGQGESEGSQLDRPEEDAVSWEWDILVGFDGGISSEFRKNRM